MNGACGLQLPDNHNESGGQGRAKPVLFSLALCEFVVIFAPQKITGKRYGANGKRGTAQKAAGRQRRTASAGSDSDQARAPPPKGARKPEGRRPAKPREKRAAIAGPRRGGPGPGERRESASERAAKRDPGARSEKKARAAKPPRPQWGLGLGRAWRERPILPQERICRRLVSDGAPGGRGPPDGDSRGARPERGRVPLFPFVVSSFLYLI